MRKTFYAKVVGLAMLLVAMCVSSAFAVVQCNEATIVKIGVSPTLEVGTASKYLVQLDCNDDTKWAGEQQFVLSTDLTESGYATMLTSYSLGQPVLVFVESAAWRSLLTLVYAVTPTPDPL